MGKKHNCPQCPLRRRYDSNSRSLIGRFWHWHLSFCPGWKAYFLSLSDEEKEQLRRQYKFSKY